ncbi:MAG: LpxD N-terminal domain-containing protein, partial [Halanaerobiales bacterium]
MNLTIEEIERIIDCKLMIKNKESSINGFASLGKAKEDEITFLKKLENYNYKYINNLDAGVIIVHKNIDYDKINKNIILVEN